MSNLGVITVKVTAAGVAEVSEALACGNHRGEGLRCLVEYARATTVESVWDQGLGVS